MDCRAGSADRGEGLVDFGDVAFADFWENKTNAWVLVVDADSAGGFAEIRGQAEELNLANLSIRVVRSVARWRTASVSPVGQDDTILFPIAIRRRVCALPPSFRQIEQQPGFSDCRDFDPFFAASGDNVDQGAMSLRPA